MDRDDGKIKIKRNKGKDKIKDRKKKNGKYNNKYIRAKESVIIKCNIMNKIKK